LYAQSDPRRAIGFFLAGRASHQAAVAARSDVLGCRDDLALLCGNLGAAYARAGADQDAEAAYAQAVAIQTQLVHAAPARRTFRRNLAVTRNNLGLLLSQRGKRREADACFRAALALYETLVAQEPNDVALESGMAGIHNNLGILLEGHGCLEDAAEAYQHAVDHQRIAYQATPAVNRYRTFLSKHYFNYGRVLRKLGHIEQAGQVALARRELWPSDPQHLLAIAEELALASGVSADSAAHIKVQEQCAIWAIETLQQAVTAGLAIPPDLAARESFAAIKDHEQFVAIVRH
jgi:tetratricopeptide (TPR) repeat protein